MRFITNTELAVRELSNYPYRPLPILKLLQDNGSTLIDLTEDLDLTSDEAMDEFKTLWQSQKSQAELSALAIPSLASSRQPTT